MFSISQIIDPDELHIPPEFVMYFNAVDINDHNSADYSVSIFTNRWYLRVFLWLVDRVVFSSYSIVCYSNKELWKRYKNKNVLNRVLQINLAVVVIEYCIKLGWEEVFLDENRTAWMRKKSFAPCACQFCLFVKLARLMMWSINQEIEKKRKEKKRKERGDMMRRFVQQKGWILVRVVVIVDHVIEHTE